MVRAKFKVDKIERSLGCKYDPATKTATPIEQWTIHMTPVYGKGDPAHENSKFWAASPGGKFELNCVNADAVRQFELGHEYYFDISPASAAE